MSSHFYFTSFIKGHKIRHIYYHLSRYPHSAQDNRLLTHTALFPAGIFAHTHAFREVAWRLLCVQVFTPSDNWHRRITGSASVLVAAHSWAEWAFVLPANGYHRKRAKAFRRIEGFFLFSFPWLNFMWPFYFEEHDSQFKKKKFKKKCGRKHSQFYCDSYVTGQYSKFTKKNSPLQRQQELVTDIKLKHKHLYSCRLRHK